MGRQEESEQSAVLVGHAGLVQGARWVLGSEAVVIGRDADCEIAIPDRQVSRHHARIRCQAGGYWLEDLKSKNGTHLNGERLTGSPVRLEDGDLIQIALAAKLYFVGADSTLPLTLQDATAHDLARIRLDRDDHRVWVGDRELDPPLSPQQFRFLELLFNQSPKIVSRDDVVAYVWQDSLGEGVSEQAIDALVRRLRERLAEKDASMTYIETIRGYGFRLKTIE